MTDKRFQASFNAVLQQPADPGLAKGWTFFVLPKSVSDTLPRRGRTTVDGNLNGVPFRQTLEPDGQLSHWMRVSSELLESASAEVGAIVDVEITPVKEEPDPDVPPDFMKALQASPEALASWDSTTTVARLDWVHWVTSAKQAKTRAKRIADACDMLASGKRRVCCFDQSGFYSKAFKAPKTAN